MVLLPSPPRCFMVAVNASWSLRQSEPCFKWYLYCDFLLYWLCYEYENFLGESLSNLAELLIWFHCAVFEFSSSEYLHSLAIYAVEIKYCFSIP